MPLDCERKGSTVKRSWSVLLIILLLLPGLFCPVCALDLSEDFPPLAALPDRPTLDLTPEEQAFVAAQDTLRVGYVQDRVPVSFQGKDGSFQGITRYIIDRVARLSGLQFEYVALPGGAVTYEYLLEGGFDLVTSVEYNKENLGARGILTSEPYFSSRKVVVGREGLEFSASNPHTVAISSGSQTIEKVLKGRFPNFTLSNYDTIPDTFDVVKNGDEDLLIQNQYVVEYLISSPLYEGLKVIPVLGLDDQLCFSAVVSFDERPGPAHEDGLMLIQILNKAIRCLTEDEVSTYTIQGIMENPYHFTLRDFTYRYRYAITVLVLALLVIAVLAVLLTRQRLRSLADRADARAREQFLSTMSHEIRTPLNGLIGLNYLMSQRLDDRPRTEEYLRRSTATAQYLLSLVNDILDMSRLQGDKMQLEEKPVDLSLLCSTVCTIVESGMAEKHLHFETQIRLEQPWVAGDGVRIQQVIMNLLDNARKFTQEGGSVALRVSQSPEPDGRVLTVVRVEDNGRGMTEAFQKRVFDSFAQELDGVSKGNQGTGLGLPISRSLARLMGGDLTFTSEKDVGSSFVFTFQAQPVPAEPEQALTQDPDAPSRVLVAEDNDLNAEILMEILQDEGFTVDRAVDGRQAVDRFSASAPGTYGLILMDMQMPNLDGCQATRAIRSLQRPDARTVRIVACTANAYAQDRQRALSSGMDGFLSKPVDVDALLRMLGR